MFSNDLLPRCQSTMSCQKEKCENMFVPKSPNPRFPLGTMTQLITMHPYSRYPYFVKFLCMENECFVSSCLNSRVKFLCLDRLYHEGKAQTRLDCFAWELCVCVSLPKKTGENISHNPSTFAISRCLSEAFWSSLG